MPTSTFFQKTTNIAFQIGLDINRFHMKDLLLLLVLFFLVGTACQGPVSDAKAAKTTTEETAKAEKVTNEKKKAKKPKPPIQLEKIKLPKGFKIELFAEKIKNARSLRRSDAGTIYVGSMRAGNVYALRDENKDFKAEKKFVIDKDLNRPNGVAYRDGSLYVAEISRILRYDNIEKNMNKEPEPTIVYDKYPTEDHHGWKYINFGPDGKLYAL